MYSSQRALQTNGKLFFTSCSCPPEHSAPPQKSPSQESTTGMLEGVEVKPASREEGLQKRLRYK